MLFLDSQSKESPEITRWTPCVNTSLTNKTNLKMFKLNMQFAYKRQNTGAGKSHFLGFLEVAQQDPLTKWRPNHEPHCRCLRYRHTFYRVFAAQASCSGTNTIVILTEMLLYLRGGRETQLHHTRGRAAAALGSHAPLSQHKKAAA